MITIALAVERIIKQKPFLAEALLSGLINKSSLSRQILPQVQQMTHKRVNEGAILMALKRLRLADAINDIGKKSKLRSDFITRSNLIEFTVLNINFLIDKHKRIIEEADKTNNYFLTITRGGFETTIIASFELSDSIIEILGRKNIVSQQEGLVSLTMRFLGDIVSVPGIYYSILKILAWENINVIEVVSTFSEFSIILDDKDVGRAFLLLKELTNVA